MNPAQSEPLIDAYELEFEEKEQGTDVFKTRFLVTDRYLRIDDPHDESGYILYDNQQKKIYSVSHYDQSILVIPEYKYTPSDLSGRVKLHYTPMQDAPQVAGRKVYRYRVSAQDDNEVCTDIQLVPGLLPKVTSMLRQYQRIRAGQQVSNLENTPDEYKTSCYLADQIFDEGEYYSKGLPIQEWHSNGKIRILSNYKETKVSPSLFVLTNDYREFSFK